MGCTTVHSSTGRGRGVNVDPHIPDPPAWEDSKHGRGHGAYVFAWVTALIFQCFARRVRCAVSFNQSCRRGLVFFCVGVAAAAGDDAAGTGAPGISPGQPERQLHRRVLRSAHPHASAAATRAQRYSLPWDALCHLSRSSRGSLRAADARTPRARWTSRRRGHLRRRTGRGAPAWLRARLQRGGRRHGAGRTGAVFAPEPAARESPRRRGEWRSSAGATDALWRGGAGKPSRCACAQSEKCFTRRSESWTRDDTFSRRAPRTSALPPREPVRTSDACARKGV